MYLLESNSNATKLALDSTSSINSIWSPQNAWILYTVIGASILLTLIGIAIIFDICYRCYEFKEQQILDGGPPASPGHQYTYTFGIQVDEASVSFDTKQTIIKLDLLDAKNQYLTSVAIPCFLFKFKQNNQKSNESSPGYPTPFTNINKNKLNYKSLTAIQENWNNTPRGSSIVFHLIRRNPLKDFASIRISHDCFKVNAYITLKHVLIRDDLSKQSARVDLVGKQIFAIHPCPPSGAQVYGAYRVVGSEQFEERKGCYQVLKGFCCL